MITVRELTRLFKIEGVRRLDEPMAEHTSFRIGGPADLYLRPSRGEEAVEILCACAREGIPAFVMGGGTNILVADRGIRGVVVDLSDIDEIRIDGDLLTAEAGAPMSSVSEAALARGLAGLEFTYSLPGSVGGAVWMNARCYDGQISDVMEGAEFVEGPAFRRHHYRMRRDDWGYKRSPFQVPDRIVLAASFRLQPGDPAAMQRRMRSYREDRERKGHFLKPCAGSVFKNNRAFGDPTGRIIDSLGLKGLRVGAAVVAPYHGNIFVNDGGARASDMRALIERVEEEVRRRRGLELEREVILVGDWG